MRADDELFNRVLERSMLDLRMLRSSLDGQAYYAAGIPWFATLFGRDSLITAIQMAAWSPEMAEQTLRVLAAQLGRRVDPVHEEEPGKVIHELRVGELAALDVTPLTRYYGTVDATPLFLCLLAEHAQWSGSLDLFHELRDAVEAALGWIDSYGDHDGDGLLDYRASTPAGLRNQGWRDSEDGVLDEHGTPLEPPIALIEPQAYAARAKRDLARLFAHAGEADRARELAVGAETLERALDRFWLPDRHFYSLALDGEGRASAALASNQGHALWAAAVSPERARAVRNALMSEDLFSGWGIRTLGRREAGFNPVGYHLGTVWPHDSALCAAGLRHYGYDDDFVTIFEALLEAASHADDYRLPELFAGFSRTEFETPVPYPVACRPQAWAAGAIPYLLTAGLGLHAAALEHTLRIRRPSLPRWVNRVEVKDLRVGDARVDLLFERAGSRVTLTDAHVDGQLRRGPRGCVMTAQRSERACRAPCRASSWPHQHREGDQAVLEGVKERESSLLPDALSRAVAATNATCATASEPAPGRLRHEHEPEASRGTGWRRHCFRSGAGSCATARNWTTPLRERQGGRCAVALAATGGRYRAASSTFLQKALVGGWRVDCIGRARLLVRLTRFA